MILRAYPHSQNYGRDICNVDTFIRVKDVERIKELKKELEKYGVIFETEAPDKLETTLHLIITIPYTIERAEK